MTLTGVWFATLRGSYAMRRRWHGRLAALAIAWHDAWFWTRPAQWPRRNPWINTERSGE